jgi:hypothetical protein
MLNDLVVFVIWLYISKDSLAVFHKTNVHSLHLHVRFIITLLHLYLSKLNCLVSSLLYWWYDMTVNNGQCQTFSSHVMTDARTRRNTHCTEQSDVGDIWKKFWEIVFIANDIWNEKQTGHGSNLGLPTLLISFVEIMWDGEIHACRQGRPLGGASGALAPGADFEGAPKRRSPTGHMLIRSTVAWWFPHLQTKIVAKIFFKFGCIGFRIFWCVFGVHICIFTLSFMFIAANIVGCRLRHQDARCTHR